MSKEKQIEEIRKDIFAAFGGYAAWEEDWQSLAEAVYNAGYRKASEVAMEIFEEIELKLSANMSCEFKDDSALWFDYYDSHLAEDIAELKKKYTGEQT